MTFFLRIVKGFGHVNLLKFAIACSKVIVLGRVCPGLRSLNLSFNSKWSIDDTGIKQIVQGIRRMGCLTQFYINLEGQKFVSDFGLDLLFNALREKSLTSLGLGVGSLQEISSIVDKN